MQKRNLIWNFIYQYGYVLTNIINSIILLPIYIEKIDSTVLGIWLTASNLLTWLTTADPGIADVLQQKIAQLKGDNQNEEISKVIGSGVIGSFLIFVFVSVFGLIFYFSLDLILNIKTEIYGSLRLAILLSILSTSIMLFSYGLAGINLGLLNSKHIANSYITGNILFFIVNFILLNKNFGIMSIAISNILRTIYVTAYSYVIIFIIRNDKIIYKLEHFKQFVKIFTFTSASKILSTISSSVDLIILAKFIPMNLVTIFEINRRPLKLTQGLAGRYSVALMPFFSHLKGVDDKEEISKHLVYHFKIFMYITLFLVYIYIYSYQKIIEIWISKTYYIGNRIVFFMIINFFFEMAGYYLSNIGYALGDIKANSILNIVKNFLLIIFSIIGAYFNGIEGLIIGILVTTIFANFLLFIIRLIKLDYLNLSFIIKIMKHWLQILPFLLLSMVLLKLFDGYFNNIENHIYTLILNCVILSVVFISCIYFFDSDFKLLMSNIKNSFEKGDNIN